MINDVPLFLYGFTVDETNRYINFRNVNAGPDILAVLNQGNYTATEYMAEIKRAMELADGVNKYTVTLNRTINSNRENRMTISTNGSFFQLLYGSGTNATASNRSIIGFNNSDYTGQLSYTGSVSAGKIVVPDFPTYDYLSPDNYFNQEGVKNVSTSGVKETLVFQQVYYFQGEWRFITSFKNNPQLLLWQDMMKYLTQQLRLEFTPSINENPNLFYPATLESTPEDGNGLAFKFKQMIDVGLYRFYKTGLLKFRVIN